mgnify:CR=1 FL=1
MSDRPSLYGGELKDQLRKLPISEPVQEFLQTCFRIRTKHRDSGEYVFQARHDFVDQEIDLEQARQELMEVLKDWNFDQIILEYKQCCCEGCFGCQRFTGEY